MTKTKSSAKGWRELAREVARVITLLTPRIESGHRSRSGSWARRSQGALAAQGRMTEVQRLQRPIMGPAVTGCVRGPFEGDEGDMTAKADFTPEEWRTVLEGPPSAGMIVVTAQRGGSIRETIAMAKAYAEARKHHGASELLDEIVSAKPEMDHTHYHSPEELKESGLQHLRDAVQVLDRKATPE